MIEPNPALLNISTTGSVSLNRDAYPKASESWNRDYELLKENSDGVSGSINDVGTELFKTQVELLATQEDVEVLQAEVLQLQTDVGTLQTNVGTLQTDVGTLQTDVIELQDRPFGQASYGTALNVIDGTIVRVPITGFFGDGVSLDNDSLTINTDYTYSYSFSMSGTFGALTTTINLAGVLFSGTGGVNAISITQFKSLIATNEFYVEIDNSSGGDINIPDLIVNLSIDKVSL